MKILMVSMSSIHFFRWTEQLKDCGHEVYWFDVYDNGKIVNRIDWVKQIVGWKRRWDFPGRFFVKKKIPRLYNWLAIINERDISKEFQKQQKLGEKAMKDEATSDKRQASSDKRQAGRIKRQAPEQDSD